MEFTLEKQVISIPTEFVIIDGVRLSFSDFDASLQVFEALGQAQGKYPEGIERRDLRHLLQMSYDSAWVKVWHARGVVLPYQYDWDNDGHTVTTEMLKAGPNYQSFMRSVKAFQVQLSAERAATAKEARRASLKAQLKALDAPAKKRPAHMRAPFYDPLFR